MNAELAHLQTPDATLRCPTGAIVWVERQQFEGTAAAGLREGTRWLDVG